MEVNNIFDQRAVIIEPYSGLAQILIENNNPDYIINQLDSDLKVLPQTKTYIDKNPPESLSNSTIILKTSVVKLVIHNNIQSESSEFQNLLFKVLDKYSIDYSNTYLKKFKNDLKIPTYEKAKANEGDQNEKSYTTKGGYPIPYQLTFGDNYFDSGQSNLQRKGDRDFNPAIRRLKEGEYSSVEIKYSLDKNFVFDGKNQIETYQDVAYLFKKLEQSAVENAFVVYVKNNKPIIQHLSMGSNVGTMVWFNAIADGITRFNPDKCYFVHNHPSGSLEPSMADVNVYDRLYEAFGSVIQEAIIIDIDSGYFSTFSDKYPVLMKNDENISNPVHYKVLKFDNAVFNKDVQREKISTSLEAASLVASQRLSNGDKLSVLILSRNNTITANLHLPYSNFDNKNIFKDISTYTARFGGTSVLFYGRFKNEFYVNQAKDLSNQLKHLGINLIDVINIKTSPELFLNKTVVNSDYLSYADEGLLEPEYRYAVAKAEELYYKFNTTNEKQTTNSIPSVSDHLGTYQTKNKINMETLKKIGNAKTHEFNSGVTVYNAGIQKSKLEGLPLNQKGYFNASMINDDNKISIVAGKVDNAIAHIYISKVKLDQIPENSGFVNFTIAPKTKKENDLSHSEFSAFLPGKDGKEPFYIGGGNIPKTIEGDLGSVFKEIIKPQNGAEFFTYDMVLDKQKLLAVPPSDKHQDFIYINVGPEPENDKFLYAYPSKGANDPNAVFTARLEYSKLLNVNENEKGEIRLTIKSKQEKNILKDNANFSVSDSSSLKGSETPLYVGKAWDIEHMYWRNQPEKGQDFFLQAGDVVQFKEKNNYYLNSSMGIKEHTAYGTVTGLSEDGKYRVESVCGNFNLDKIEVRKADSPALENFNNSYEALVNSKNEERKANRSVKSKDTVNENSTKIPKESAKKPLNKNKAQSNDNAL